MKDGLIERIAITVVTIKKDITDFNFIPNSQTIKHHS